MPLRRSLAGKRLEVAAPLGRKHGIDIDAGRILGGVTGFPAASPHSRATSTHFYSVQLRFMRPRQSDGASQYFLAGLQFIDLNKFDQQDAQVVDELVSAALLGFGFDQLFDNRTRLVAEVGLSGGDALDSAVLEPVSDIHHPVGWKP